MFNYHRPHEFLVNHLSFEVDSMSYVGSGFLQWNPMQGFHLLARVQHLGDPVLKRSIRQLTVTRRTVLRMRIGKMQHAFAPNVYVDDSHLMTDHLSIDFSRVIFVQRESRDLSRDNWSGQALLKTTTSSMLPDSVRKETTIGEGKPHWGLSMSGIDHRDTSGLSIQGMRNEDQIEVFWSLPRSHKAKQQSWCIPEGLCSALTVLDGTVPRLLFREVNRIGCTYREVWAPRQPSSLGIIFRPHDAGRIDRNHLVRLTTFFAQESHEAIICRQMLGQMIEAARQQTWQARELLLSMIFEAVLRTVYNAPFMPGSRQDFAVDEYLTRFTRDYLTDDQVLLQHWKAVNSKAMQVRRTLRHRNAHPDWLASTGGSGTPETLKVVLDSIIFLSRFYGYMILGMAGIRNLEPKFPIEFEQWPPMLTIETQL